MANWFATGQVEERRLLALHTCIDVLMQTSGLSIQKIVDGAEIDRDTYNNVWRAQRPSPAVVNKIYASVSNALDGMPDWSCPLWIQPAFKFVFPDLARFQNVGDAFMDCADPISSDPTFFSTYVGTYRVYRYAANINVDPATPLPAGTAFVPTEVRDRIDARVVKAALKIFQSPLSRWPLFDLHYQAREPHRRIETEIIKGILIPVRDHVYLMGIEQNIRSPMVIALKRRFAQVSVIEGMVLRKHEVGQILASRVVLVKREQEFSFEEECRNIGLFRESAIMDEIENIQSLMYNDVKQYGKGNLLL